LTLRFNPKALAQLTPSNGGDPIMQVATGASEFAIRSRIRIFHGPSGSLLEKSWTPPRLKEQSFDAIVDFNAPLTGNLRIFERQKSARLDEFGAQARRGY